MTFGSCLCQQVRFEIQGSFDGFILCHCKHCQKDTGSAHAANLFSSKATLHWKSGEEKVTTYNLPSTRHQKSFCSVCGSALPNHHLGGTLLVVPAGCLDEEIKMRPNAHIFHASRADWENDLDSVMKYDKLPPELE